MLTRRIVRFSVVAVVGFACMLATEARAQIVSGLTAPLSCTVPLGEGTLTVQAGPDGIPFPEIVPCPGEGASGTCSKYTYKYMSSGGSINQTYLSVSSDLDIYATSPTATIENPSCAGEGLPKIGVFVCEQRQVRFGGGEGSMLTASITVERTVPRVSTVGARKGLFHLGFCLIQGPGAPAAPFETFTQNRNDRVANNQCTAPVTVGPDGGVIDAAPPLEEGCGYNPNATVTINGQERKNVTKLEPDTFGNGTTTCYRTSSGRSICYCKNPSSPCPN